MFGTTE